MDEIEYKLKTDNGILISGAVSKLVEAIKKKNKDSRLQECAEFRMLQESCISSKPILSITACHGMAILAEDGVIDFNYVFSTLISSISSTKFYTGLISTLRQLMLMDLKLRIHDTTNCPYKNPFNMSSPQHPFITILAKNSSTWNDILNEIDHILNDNSGISHEHKLEFLRPVLLYVLLNKTSDLGETCRQQIWRLLLKRLHHKDVQGILMETLAWSAIGTNKDCLSTSILCIEVIDRALLLNNSQLFLCLVPYLVSIMPSLVSFGFDPKPSIAIILKVLDTGKYLVNGNQIIMLLAECIDNCPSVHLEEIILLCDIILEKQTVNFIATQILISSILQWMAYSSNLTQQALRIASKLIHHVKNCKRLSYDNNELESSELFRITKYFSGKLLKYDQLSEISENFRRNPGVLDDWLEKLSQMQDHVYLYDIRNFLYGVFICDFKSDVVVKVLELLVNALKVDSKMAVGLLTLILYKLSHETDAIIQLQLLRALPQMAVVKENVPLIVHTLGSLKKGPMSLRCLCVDLQMRLCRVEVRCYPYLQESLVEVCADKKHDWYMDIIKAVAIRELCVTRPEHHGSELVAHISRLLNRCVDSRGAVASSIALDSISQLCQAAVVDVVSTWRALSPRLNKDTRPRVIISLCKFFSIVPSLSADSEDYHKLIDESIRTLWSYVTNFDEKEIIDAALGALALYPLDDMSLKQLPELFRRDLRLPSAYCKTPEDAARRPEDVLTYIPGSCWVQLLHNVNHSCLDKAGDLLSAWMTAEIAQYRSGVYAVSGGKGEPNDCTALTEKSVVRAVVEFVLNQAKTKISSYDCPPMVLRQCLRILSLPYPKPLPPVNWCCLHDLYHRDFGDNIGAASGFITDIQSRLYCVTIATRQMVISGSAKRFVENYLDAFDATTAGTSTIEELLNIYANLPYYCKSIAPNNLRKVIDSTLEMALENALCSGTHSGEKNDDRPFREIMGHIEKALRVQDIHDANRDLLAQSVERLIDKIHYDDELFQCYADCCLQLPMLYFDRIASPSIWWESTSAKVRKATIIRCTMATKTIEDDKALVWLNEIVEIGMTENAEQNFILAKLIRIVQLRYSIKFTKANCDWCLELMGKTQAELVRLQDNAPVNISQNSITFLCDVLMLTLECLSGAVLLKVRDFDDVVTSEIKFDLFPAAVNVLCMNERWSSTMAQIIEWLHHMTSSPMLPNIYISTFRKALMMSKMHKHFEQKTLWYKVIQENFVKSI